MTGEVGPLRPTIVIALGGNALLRRSEPMTVEVQARNVRVAARAIAPLTGRNRVVVAHGNGPQVGLLALQAAAYRPVAPYPLDVLGAETQGMIGYLLERELRNALPPGTGLATLLTMIEVDPGDPAFGRPTKFVGPVYERGEAERQMTERGWGFARDGEGWRRVVASPAPVRILEMDAVRWLLERESVVICAGGGGIPVAPAGAGFVGVEAVIDKDRASGLLAEAIDADVFVMATDVDGVYTGWGTRDQRRLGALTPEEVAGHDFPAGSMGPKVEAAARFASATGRRAAIGSLEEVAAIVRGEAGTQVTREMPAGHVTSFADDGRSTA